MDPPAPAFARYCIRCGRERLPGARFCVACGLAFADPAAPQPTAVEPSPVRPYPIRCQIPFEARRLRVLTVVRIVLVLPHLIGWALVIPVSIAVSLLSWLSALAIGRVPDPLHRVQAAVLAYVTRIAVYLCLASDRWPPFPWQRALDHPVQVEVDPPGRFSRLVALVVLPRALPAVITAVLFGFVAWMLAVGAWFAILATGRFPRTIHEMLELSIGFQCRTLGHFPLLLTDDYPWYESGPLMLPSRRPDRPVAGDRAAGSPR